MLERARFLHRLGFTVLAPDFQADGESPGEHVSARASLDAAASMTFLRGAMPADESA
jgi:alpha/beta superfamily hydrolase